MNKLLGLQEVEVEVEVEVDGISRQSKHEDGKVVSSRHLPPLLTADITFTHFY